MEDKSIGIKFNASNIVISEEKQSETQTPKRDPLKASMFETMNSIVSKDELPGHMQQQSQVLNHLSEYHSQYNRFEDIMNFKKKLTKKDLFTYDHHINPRLNQIH